MHKNSGFTMIEIVAACVIIAIILAIGIPSYISSMEIAKCNKAMGILKSITTAAYDFYAEFDTFTGINIAAINTQAGSSIVNNTDWTFAATPTGGGSGITAIATRLKGPHGAGGTITLDQDYVWAGTYPYTDPGNF